jgi:hypothetical protein
LSELAESAKRAKAADEQRRHEAATRSAESADLALVKERRRHEAVLAAECDKQHRHEAVLATQADELRRHEAVLATQADGQRRHEAAARAVESAALTLVEERRRHEAVLAAEKADEQRRHESAARAAESDAVFDCIRTEFTLYAAPLDAILAEIACKEAAFKAVLHHMWTQSCPIWGGAHNHL